MALTPFSNMARTIGELEIEHDEAKVSLYGSLDIPKTIAGKELATALAAEINAIVKFFEDNPPRSSLGIDVATTLVDNPFA